MLTITDIENIFNAHFKRVVDPKVSVIHHGAMNFTYDINIRANNYILKVYPPSRSGVAIKEYRLLKKIKKSALKSPKVKCGGTYSGYSYLIYKKIPGVPLHFDSLPPGYKKQICGQIALNLKQFSDVSFKKYGSLTEEEITFSSWKDFLAHNINMGLDDFRKVDLNIDFNINSVKDFLLDYINNFHEIPCGLVWSDFNQGNIIIHDNQLSGFIDFEGCFYGDPRLSLGYLFAKDGTSEFFKHIKNEMQLFINVDENDIYFYALLRLLRISKYLAQPMPNGQPRSPVLNHFKGIREVLNVVGKP